MAIDKATQPDQWAAGSSYEDFMGRWSRLLAPRFVEWLGCDCGLDWLEIGCGTGALTEAIYRQANPRSLTACDPSAAFLDCARQNVPDPRVTFALGGADDFPLRSEGYGAVTSLLVLNFVPAPAAALERIAHAARDGAVISAGVWDYAGEMLFLRHFWSAAVEVDPRARDADEGLRFPLCRSDRLIELFRGSGLEDVCCEALEIVTDFSDFEDYWRPMLGGTGPAPTFAASLEPEERNRLRAELQRRLPTEADGRISLKARSWAVRGRKSST